MGFATMHPTATSADDQIQAEDAVEALREKIRFVADVLCAYGGLCDEMYTRIFTDTALGLGDNPADNEGEFTVTITGVIGGISFESQQEDVEAYTQRGAELKFLEGMQVDNPIPEWDRVDRAAVTETGPIGRMLERLLVHAKYATDRGSLLPAELNRYLVYMGAETLKVKRTYTFTVELPMPPRVVEYSAAGFSEEEAHRVAAEFVAADDRRIATGSRRNNGRLLDSTAPALMTPAGDAPLVFKSVE